jgi:hypothetical protein
VEPPFAALGNADSKGSSIVRQAFVVPRPRAHFAIQASKPKNDYTRGNEPHGVANSPHSFLIRSRNT